MRTLLLPLIVTLLMSGCATVQPIQGVASNPLPNTPFTTVSAQTLALDLGPGVVNTQLLADNEDDPRAPATALTAWRQTLSNGYINGVGAYFHTALPGRPADLTLDILRADPAWTQSGRLTVQVTYKAQLVDRNGKIVAVSAGTVRSKHAYSTTDDGAESDCVNSAVESLYEQLASELVRPAVPLNNS